MNYTTRTNHNSRSGVTLLFTISMIVLFLLMGTTFVVVANDYYKTAIRRSRLNTYKVDVASLMDRAFYDAFRGPSLNDDSSPLRGHDLLSDVYGYGFRGTLSGAGDITTLGSSLVVLSVDDSATQLLREETGVITTDPGYVDGLFNGRLITFTTGEATGYSTRILGQAHVDTDSDGAPDELQFVVPRDSAGIDWTAVADGAEYIVNGREYSGFGAGDWAAAAYTYDPDAAAAGWLNVNCLFPVCTRQHRDVLTDDTSTPAGYLRSAQSPNEPYDAPDYQNMLLAGQDGAGDTIPSGHRDRLYADRAPGNNAFAARTLTMRPLYLATSATDDTPRDGSTANADFPSSFIDPITGNLIHGINDEDSLDVDNDNSGTNDSVWIDIGLPVQTDSQGRQFRPLVAYHIVDLDGRLNLNVHGSHADQTTGSLDRYGTAMGPSDISLNLVAGGDYGSLLDDRYGDGGDNIPGNTANSLTSGQKLFGTPRAPEYVGGLFGTSLPFLSEAALTLPAPAAGNVDDFPSYYVDPTDLTSDVKLTASPYASDFSVGGGVGDRHFLASELESIYRANDIDGSLLGGRLYDFSTVRGNAGKVTTDSFEIAIPAAPRSIVELLRERVRDEPSITTDADMREVVREFLLGTINPVNKYISKEMLLGGRFDLNRPLGDGLDNDGDGAIDDAEELGATAQSTSGYAQNEQQQYNTPTFDLDNESNGTTGDAQAKVIMARQLYVLALLVAGENTATLSEAFPAVPAIPGPAMTSDLSYRKAVAQWAVNVVDYRDPDSIMTVFEYDTNPFNDPRIPGNVVDGDPSTTGETDRGIVIGLERPELLMTETFAVHDRQLQDTNTDPSGDDVAGGDLDWDSPRLPNTNAFIELYHPWRQSYGATDSFQNLPRELTKDPSVNPDGVHLDKLAPDDTPVWRIVVRRGSSALTPNEAVRSIYFADPSGSAAPTVGDAFYPAGAVNTVAPGEYAVISSPGNVAGRNMTTFGRLTTISDPDEGPSPAEINMTRSIELTGTGVVVRGPTAGESVSRPCKTIIINRSVQSGGATRGLSLSEPNFPGYVIPASSDIQSDGTMLTDGAFPPANQARDTPYDADLGTTGYHDADDVDAIWTNGVKKDASYQFRVLHLERLADPTSAFDMNTNPYVTVDIASVDLLAYNSLVSNSDNGASPENGLTIAGDINSALTPTDGDTQMGGIARGEKIARDAFDNSTLPTPAEQQAEGRQIARRSLFRFAGERKNFTGDVASSTGDDHTLSYSFSNLSDPMYPERLETLGGRNDAYDDDTVPFGWLAWNNRPYANHMELAQVPMLSAEGLVRHFGESEADPTPPSIGTEETSDKSFAYFFGDDQFGHLPGFGGVVRGGGGGGLAPNRFDGLLDFVEVPNRFLGSETYLPADVAAAGPLLVNLNAPFRSIPNFRYPGKVNINTIYSEDVWDAVRRGFGPTATLDFDTFRANRSFADGPTDIGRVYTTAEGSEFVEAGASNDRLRKGQSGAMFRPNGAAKLFDSENDTTVEGGTDIESAATFRNEVRTRLGGLTTTRSSVYAFWITIGYFEVDEFGRVGAEIGADEGQVQRNRAFYMVDRSIPVASEPGKNHNVDQAVLVRTIIE